MQLDWWTLRETLEGSCSTCSFHTAWTSFDMQQYRLFVRKRQLFVLCWNETSNTLRSLSEAAEVIDILLVDHLLRLAALIHPGSDHTTNLALKFPAAGLWRILLSVLFPWLLKFKRNSFNQCLVECDALLLPESGCNVLKCLPVIAEQQKQKKVSVTDRPVKCEISCYCANEPKTTAVLVLHLGKWIISKASKSQVYHSYASHWDQFGRVMVFWNIQTVFLLEMVIPRKSLVAALPAQSSDFTLTRTSGDTTAE